MDDKASDNVIDIKRSKFSIRELLASPAPPKERPSGDTPWPRPGPPPLPEPEPIESTGNASPSREPGDVDMDLPEAIDPLPKAGDPYKAHSRAANKPVLMVSFVLKDGTTSRGYSFANFDSIDRLPSPTPGGGPVIVIRFAGLVPTEIRIEGRNLSTLYAYLSQHRVAWLRERGGRDFLDESATVVTGITITTLK